MFGLDKLMGGSDLVSSALDYTFQSKQASRSRAFSKRMDDTKYQRSMADMEKAGLNPILAAIKGITTGSGASAPASPSGGAMAANRQASTARSLMNSQKNKLDAETHLTNEKAKVVSPIATGMEEINSALKSIRSIISGDSEDTPVLPSVVNSARDLGRSVRDSLKATSSGKIKTLPDGSKVITDYKHPKNTKRSKRQTRRGIR